MNPLGFLKRIRSTPEILRRHLWQLKSAYYLVGEAEPVTKILEPGVAWVVTGHYHEN